ncbi:MAG: FAD-binding oxidoreductase [Novosphingobium sp.]|nr:FAD-binding oxidoreductase [Novosphingobium sp.]MBX9644588.1 FAD-binding oxidoreductase [Novosphingobium sp.]
MEASVIQALKEAVGAGIVHDDAASLHARRFDRWSVNHCRDWQGQTLPEPGCVVRPRSVEDVQKVARFANTNGVAVMPYGSGSGVCGGVVGDPATILLDMGEMNRVREIDETNLLASFDAGLNGLEAEQAVAAKGLTIGHWPQSIAISTVGGWVSTRASGQFSSAYGNIEDMIYSIEAVLPNGELVTLGKAPRAAAGPDLRHIVMGAEGIMGIVTGVTLMLRRAAEHRDFTAFHARDMALGFEAQRRIYHAEWRPPVMRQYDAPEVNRLFSDYTNGDDCLLIMVHEGPRARVEAEVVALREIALGLGLTQASPEAVKGWLEKRNHVPDWTDLFKLGVIADTIEISGKWTQIDAIYADVMAALRTVPAIVNASAHSSHAYRSGINIYCTFACRPTEAGEMEALYFEAWDKALEACAAAGGGIAHHHGSGRLRKKYLHHDLGEQGIALLRRVKAALDPQGIMNPGNLLPDVQ